MQALDALAPVFAVHIGVDVVHRARTIERDDGDDVLEAVRLQLAQRIAHALTFELEHADRVALLQQFERRRVVERQLAGVDVDAPPRDQLPRRLDHREGLEAQEIELHQPRGLRPFHAELGRRQLRARVAVERHEVDQRPVGDDHARGMGRGVTVEPLQPLADIEQLRHDRFGVARLLQPRLGGDGLRQGDGIGGVHRHELAEPIDLAIGHLQHAADVTQHGARLQLAKGDDVGDAVRTIALAHIGDHLVAAVLAEIDVEIGHRHAFGIEEALEQQAEADRIEIGDGERIGDQRARAGATAGANGDAFGLGPFDEVGDDQEVALIVHAGDDIELEGEPLGIGRSVKARRHAVLGDAFLEPGFRLAPELGRFGLAESSRGFPAGEERREDRLALQWPVSATARDLDGVVQRLGQIGEQRPHLRAGLEVMLGAQAAPLVDGDIASLGDADQRVMRLEILLRGEIRFVGRDDGQVEVVSKLEQLRLDRPLLRQAVALKLDIEPVAEDASQRI